MKTLYRMFVAALLTAAFTASAMAAPITCTSTSTWTTLGPPGSVNFGQTFGAAGSYHDCYTFVLAANANSSGTTLENNLLFDRLFLDVTSVTLFTGGITLGKTSAVSLATDTSPAAFSFVNLAAGTYTLDVASTVYNSPGLYTSPVSYTGKVTTVAGTTTTPVPEPGSIALLAIGLLGVFAGLRKRQA